MKAAFLFALLVLYPVSAIAQGKPGVLNCTFKGGLDLHGSADASSRVVGRVQCGSGLLIIDQSNYAPRVRTMDGTVGYIVGLNFGQWSIRPETAPAVSNVVQVPVATVATPQQPPPPQPPPVVSAPKPAPPQEEKTQRPTQEIASNRKPTPPPEPPPIVFSAAPARAEDSLRTAAAAPNVMATNGSLRIQPGDRIFVPRMEGALHAYIAAELVKKLPVMVVQDESAADFVLSSAARKTDERWFNALFSKNSAEGNVQLFYTRSRTLVWSGETGDRSLWFDSLSNDDPRKLAARIVDKLKRDLFR